MLVDVIEMRSDGAKLRPDVIREAKPVRGHLVIYTNPRPTSGRPGSPEGPTTFAALVAKMPPDAPSLFPVLRDARVTRISGESLVIVGAQQTEGGNAFADPVAQAWWCRIVYGFSAS